MPTEQCDEVHPRCGNCAKHGVPCDFASPALAESLSAAQTAATSPTTPSPNTASPAFDFVSPPSVTAATPATPATSATTVLCRQPPAPVRSPATTEASRLLELRLLHQYITYTSKTLSLASSKNEEIWRDTVPLMAFAGSSHLTDAVLAIAALHLRSLNPGDRELVRASHAYMASCLRQYSQALNDGITQSNAVPLFLTCALIAFQSTATRIFTKDELGLLRGSGPAGCYSLPLAWFHSFQGVKAVTAASWTWIRQSDVVRGIIDSQPVLRLDFASTKDAFFGHLLDGLDEELAALPEDAPGPGLPAIGAESLPSSSLASSTRQAYEHAVTVLNWAHNIPHGGASLAFPATVSRRYVELLEERKPRAIAILACFFALLKSLDGIWWLRGISRREVLGCVSLFNSDLFGPDIEQRWWPHIEWAVRVALFDDSKQPGHIPPEVWGTIRQDDDAAHESHTFVKHIDVLSEFLSGLQSFPMQTAAAEQGF